MVLIFFSRLGPANLLSVVWYISQVFNVFSCADSDSRFHVQQIVNCAVFAEVLAALSVSWGCALLGCITIVALVLRLAALKFAG